MFGSPTEDNPGKDKVGSYSEKSSSLNSQEGSIKHSWENEQAFIKGQEMKKIKNVLVYRPVKYGEHDWDNIAPVVTRFIMHLSKYMEGLCEVLHHETALETTSSLRSYSETNFSSMSSTVSLHRENHEKTEEDLLDYLKRTEGFAEKLRGEYDQHFENSHYPNRDERKMVEFYRRFVAKDAAEENETDDSGDEEEKAKLEVERRHAIDMPRLLSIKTFVDMFEAVGANSSLSKRCDTHDEQIQKIHKDIIAMNKQSGLLKSNIDNVEKSAEVNLQNVQREQKKVNERVQRQFEEQKKDAKGIKEKADRQRLDHEKLGVACDQISLNLNTVRQDLSKQGADQTRKHNMLADETNERIDEVNKWFGDISEQLQAEIKDVRYIAEEKMQQDKEEIKSHFRAEFNDMKDDFYARNESVKKSLKEVQQKVTTSIKNVKNVCSEWFQKTEMSVEENKIRQHVLEDKYAEWQRIVIEPQSMNDARLFSVESRVGEEEEMRIKEFDFLRDLMKKLVYSLEQISITNLDSKQSLDQESDGKTLPNLLSPNRRSSAREIGSGAMEMMMLKRLNFLRNSLDLHNSRVTTEALRDNAARKRDERILELWSKDQSRPSVPQLVEKMRWEKMNEKRDDFDLNHSPNELDHTMTSLKQKSSLFTQNTSIMVGDDNLQQKSINLPGHNAAKGLFEENSIQLESIRQSQTGESDMKNSKLSAKKQDMLFKRSTRQNTTFQTSNGQMAENSTQKEFIMEEDPMAKHSRQRKVEDKFAKHVFATQRDAEQEQKRKDSMLASKRNASLQPFWKDFNEGISSMGNKLDPNQDPNVPSHRISVSKKKTPKKFAPGSMRPNPAMNQTQIIFSGKETDLIEGEDVNLPTLVGSAQTARGGGRNSQEQIGQPPFAVDSGSIQLIRNENQQQQQLDTIKNLKQQDLNQPSTYEQM